MRILVLGGTAWLGRTFVQQALAAGHDVVCAARGSGVPDGARSLVVDRDDEGALTDVAAEHWDAVLDVSRTPEHVRRAARDLGRATDRFLLVSTVSVYASHAGRQAAEDAPVLAPSDDPAEYGAAKVACEHAVLDAVGPERAVLARAGLIGGPGDHTGRSGHWPWRFARAAETGGAVLVPAADDGSPSTHPTSVVDVRDLAAWLLRQATARDAAAASGPVNVTGEAVPLGALLATARAVALRATTAEHTAQDGVPTVPVSDAWLAEHDVAPWSGPRSLPLWLPDADWQGLSDRSNARARATGLTLRPLAETLADTLRWEAGRPEHPHGAGLTDVEHDALVSAARRR
ncbi:NAD-dependent epimerase/dehydratase family protein [Curtobacterium sp. MCSS17_007]|uniref:NAD-dependent epimerase/dehydratase family protein n=1 Tax=Curtobacterium sp. MCSS17_007 TaxID=2175646 RepID=UPI000DA9F5DD|nr:NAD-dependent epimerase/dehydratase family protein [Curtobacterium sp. MCSS17_007]WIE75886.1 NAD-dependent epimerase/dehydratase family protein [Curtobacterium sp. MCSS17_007]